MSGKKEAGESSELASWLHSLNRPASRDALYTSVLPSLLNGIAQIGKALRSATDVALVGSANAFGDEQLNVDVLAEQILRDVIAQCPAICTASSEEDPVERPARAGEETTARDGEEQYAVAFDPLDGSSIIAPNWTVGTIIGVWDGVSALNQDPATRQVASVLGVYGPRTTAIVALRVPGSDDVCFEVGLTGEATPRCSIVRPSVQLASPPFSTRYFAPANLRAAAEDAAYMSLITRFVREKYTLRYSGGLIPDVVHALVKGHGVYVSPVTAASRAKLRRLYELCPVALVVECAGGRAVDPKDGERVLGRVVADCDERGGLICGTASEVEAVRDALLGES
ncbi:fructose-1,6-bisphosphatase class 1/Sedoheputulose-1,7-bisphosphatase [Dactylonectria estremocensis]|uniref:Fructose-1,6-bisphosphatase class 1/Sedoheputulose-1,7-bisphosphatase n=1 Tax=Dactylonectria estremocensis TaxID=1079267 RepID=A0A9P9EQB6_9HYPO|nr:fructose-1,6-bisphosphatase class 1/Sedoheputulose-1,7-bisphosphatase [Dactylonectria estremocensis]